MCGIAGYLDRSGLYQGDWQKVSKLMSDSIYHRGPDNGGDWFDGGSGLCLVHRRLSVLDLSPAGHQPMVSPCGRFVITFNGEIYNHLDLRAEIGSQGYQWCSNSDTETLLLGFKKWGVTRTLQKSVGMFALAVWDRQRKTLTLARDRVGEKPLYYGLQNGVFIFGSELRALKAHPAFSGKIDRDSLCLFLRHNYIPAPNSIYSGIKKVPPGSFIEFFVSDREMTRQELPEPTIYWSAHSVIEEGRSNPFMGDEIEAANSLECLLKQAVRRQMLSDVPLGAFLSGGVDSSTIVALMQAQSARPVKTFSIGFHEEAYNEAEYAEAVAGYLGTEHTSLYVTANQAMEVIPNLPTIYDEPFADSSQIPTYLLSALAAQHVTVSLSGDGADEMFCGYDRYFQASKLWKHISFLPFPVRSALQNLLSYVPINAWNCVLKPFAGMVPNRYQGWNFGDKLHKLSEVLDSSSPDLLYQQLVSHWKNPMDIVIGGVEKPNFRKWPAFNDGALVQAFMSKDIVSYLPDNIMVKVDRAGMARGIETRAPYLDHNLIEFASRLQLSMKVRNGEGKWLLRQLLYKYVPRELVERPKKGFGVPIEVWLRGPLREWAEELLNETRLKNEGFFNPQPIRQRWSEHLSGSRNWHSSLWNVLMFQAWLESNTG